MREKRASGTKHARIRETIYRSKTLVCKILSLILPLKTFILNFVAFFVFSGTASSCNFQDFFFRNTGETRVYTRHFGFVWLTHYSLGRG